MGFSSEKTFDIEVWIPLKKNTGKSQVAHHVDLFKQEEWVLNINLVMATILLAH